MTCPRCEGQRHDVGSCAICGSLGWLCPDCAGRMQRTPIYSDGRKVYRCTECRCLVVNELERPHAQGKLIPLSRPQGLTG